jgi:Tol biopolymer transport system component
MEVVRDSDSGKYYYDPFGTSVDAGIYTFSPEGSRFSLVIEGGMRPTWSPDGSRIAFEGLRRDGNQPSRFMIADADGSDRQDLSLPAMGPGFWHPGPYRFAVRET